jgi:hypothetical protein
MSWLTEDPTLVLILAGVAELVLLGVFLVGRLAKVLVAMVAVAALAGVLLLVEALVVTDRERIHETVIQLIDGVRSEDVAAVLAGISSRTEAAALRDVAQQYVPDADVGSLGILDLKIDVQQPPTPALDSTPRWGRAVITVIGSMEYQGIARPVKAKSTLLFVPEGDGWRLLTIEAHEGAGEEQLSSLRNLRDAGAGRR